MRRAQSSCSNETSRRRRMTAWAAIILALASAGTGCGGRDDAETDSDLLPASALDGALVEHRRERFLPGQIFHRNIRERALRFESSVDRVRAPLDDPRHAEVVAKEFRRALRDASEMPRRAVAVTSEVRVVPTGRSRPPHARLRRFTATMHNPVLRAISVHPKSPACDLENVRLVDTPPSDGGDGTSFAILTDATPDIDRLSQLAAAGARFVVVTSDVADVYLGQVSYPEDVAGAGEVLPIPVVFTCRGNKIHLQEIRDAGARVALRVDDDAAGAPEGVCVVTTIAGSDRSRLLIVRASGCGVPFGFEAGSRSVALSTVVEVARVYAIARARNADLLTCDVAFVHRLDGGVDDAWLRSVVPAGVRIGGILEVGCAVWPEGADTVYAQLAADTPGSILEHAACEVVAAYRSKPGAWSNCGIDGSLQELSRDVCGDLGQERIPRVRFCVGEGRESRPSLPVARYSDPPLAAPVVGPCHPFARTPFDTVARVADAQMSGAVALGRAVLLALLRAAHSYRG